MLWCRAGARLLLCVGLTAAAAGCGAGGSGEGPGDVETIRITVSQWPSLAFAVPYHVAMAEGYFEDVGIHIEEVINGDGGGATVRNILAGDLDFGEISSAALVQSQDAGGSTLVGVGGGAQQVGEVVWVAPKDSPLESIDDLIGRKVGYTTTGSVTQSALAISLERAGVDLAQVQLVSTGGVAQGLAAMEGGAIDATIHADPVFAGASSDFKLLWRATDYITDYQQMVIVTSPAMADENPELVTNFLEARSRALDFMKSNPEEAARIWSERGDVPLEAAKATLQELNSVGEWNVGFNPDGLVTAREGMQAAGLLGPTETIDWNDYLRQDLLPEGVDEVELPIR